MRDEVYLGGTGNRNLLEEIAMNSDNDQPNINWETVRGSTWAADTDDIARAYAGKLVVAIPGKIIAYEDDLDSVVQEGARILGVDPSTVVARSIVHPDEWFKDYPICTRLEVFAARLRSVV